MTHRYAEALLAYEKRSRSGLTSTALETANRATALLCLGRLRDALEGFEKANELAGIELRGQSEPYLEKIGTTLWLLGERDSAIRTWMAAIQGLVDGRTKFADAAGGASAGLLLWFAGERTGQLNVTSLARDFLSRLAKGGRSGPWPASLGLFVLGGRTREEVLEELAGTKSMTEGISRATNSLLVRRRLAKFLFYLAQVRSAAGDLGEHREILAACAQLENPIIEPEWYLARYELAAC